MAAHNGNQTEQALNNLQQIKEGSDPRDEPTKSRVERVQDEVSRLMDEYEMPRGLERYQIHCYVAEWQRRIGQANYNQYVEPREYGQRVTGRSHSDEHYGIGIATRAFDSDDTWLDTVAHELAHITAYVRPEGGGRYTSDGHGDLWQAEAERLGADPTRTDRVAPENRVDHNYVVSCTQCSARWTRLRRSKLVKHPNRYSCGNCGGDLKSWEVDG